MEAKKRNCCCCGRVFIPNKRLGDRQKTCGRANCKKKRNRENQRNWRRKNPEYFRGRYDETKAWLERNPGYLKQWRRAARDIQNSIPHISPMKSIRCILPVNLLKNDIQNSMLLLTPIDKRTYEAWTGEVIYKTR